MKKKIIIAVTLFTGFINAQLSIDNQINFVLDDLVLYTNKFTEKATTSLIYQSSNSWMQSPKLKEKWKFNLALNSNIFIVSNANKTFQVKNSDFKILRLQGINDDRVINVQSAYGGTSDIYLYASTPLGDVRTKFDGINENQIAYPFIQGGVALPRGFEIMAKYSVRIKLKQGEHQIYGFALQYNLNQHFEKLKGKNINIAALIAYNNEDVIGNYLNESLSSFPLGIEKLNTNIDTYQFQLSGSKVYKKFEFTAGLIYNKSNLKNTFIGNKTGIIENSEDLFNKKAKESLDKTQTLFLANVSAKYECFNNVFLQSTFALRNEINASLGLQYEFN